MIRFCLPIIATSSEEIESIIKTNMSQYDYFEIWLDYISNFNSQFLRSLLSKYSNELIIVTRRLNLEPIHLNFDTRCQIIKLSSELNVLIDLDIHHQKNEIAHINDNSIDCRLLLSYHNYTFTPDSTELMAIIEDMSKFNPEIYKIATYCTSREDSLRLLKILLELQKQKKRLILIGMGKYGQITRLYGCMWGSYINFAPLTTNQSSAPGQFTIAQYKQIIKDLR
jgi:3-dehydroquinate dehydratase-1